MNEPLVFISITYYI